ncbi:MAG: DUF5337 domain-containing protein [Pseudomonadota bacterium]
MDERNARAKKGRRAALVIAGTGVFWVLATLIGQKEGFSVQVLLVLDLIALCGFLLAFWLIYQLWREGR